MSGQHTTRDKIWGLLFSNHNKNLRSWYLLVATGYDEAVLTSTRKMFYGIIRKIIPKLYLLPLIFSCLSVLYHYLYQFRSGDSGTFIRRPGLISVLLNFAYNIQEFDKKKVQGAGQANNYVS